MDHEHGGKFSGRFRGSNEIAADNRQRLEGCCRSTHRSTQITLAHAARYLARPRWSRELPAGRWSPWAFEDRLGESVWCWIHILPVWKKRLDAKTLVTTPNSDVIYAISYLDVGKDGPFVFDAPIGGK
jgi:hypothetical protein